MSGDNKIVYNIFLRQEGFSATSIHISSSNSCLCSLPFIFKKKAALKPPCMLNESFSGYAKGGVLSPNHLMVGIGLLNRTRADDN